MTFQSAFTNTWFNCSSNLKTVTGWFLNFFLFQNNQRIRIFTSKKRTNDTLFRQVSVCKILIQRQGPDWHYPILSLPVVFEVTASASRCCLVQRRLLYTQIQRRLLPLIAYGPSKAFVSITLRWHTSAVWLSLGLSFLGQGVFLEWIDMRVLPKLWVLICSP